MNADYLSYQTLMESKRHNLAQETQAAAELKETTRKNTATMRNAELDRQARYPLIADALSGGQYLDSATGDYAPRSESTQSAVNAAQGLEFARRGIMEIFGTFLGGKRK